MPNKAQDDELVMSLVELALTRAPEEREAYLRSACDHDSQLFDEVRKYIEWEERMNGFLLEPLYPSPSYELRLEPGELLDGRFRILREIAQGGMGIVYEAHDEKLERRIAIKCAKPGFRKRLPPEVRHATEVSHPNICKIFEIHTASTDRGEIDFITMEFLDGETLTDRLRRGLLPETEARAIAQQVCAGLAAAHRNDVIHGDLKGSNVILTKAADGSIRAVITDFGLARRPETTGQTIRSGALGGTPDYMAPELWKGEKATAASDIYALGVILHELAAGRVPFRSSPEASWEERLSARPSAVNPKWDRVLARCLETDPGRRFRGAQEVGQALLPRSRKWMLAVAAAVVFAAVSGVVTYERAAAPPETVRLTLGDLEAGPERASLSQNILRETAAQLARLRGNAHTRFLFVRQAKQAAATHVLHGTLRKENDKLQLHVQLTNASSHTEEKQWDAEYAPGETRYIPAALAGIVTETFRLPLLATRATVNGAAIQDYMKGMAALRHVGTGVDSALALFERAVAADPDSPLTHTAMAEAQWFKYYATKDQVWLDRATESEKQAERRDPDSAAVHRIHGLLIYHSGGYDEAVKEYQRAIELEPYNGDAYRRLGMAYEDNNQLDEALAAYRQAVEIEPGFYGNHTTLGAFYSERSNYPDAARQYERAVQLAPGEPDARFGLGLAYLDLGRFADAESALRTAISLKPIPTALHTLGIALMYEGREQEAIPYFLQALTLVPGRYLSWVNLGICYRRINLRGESQHAYKQGLEAAEAEMARNPRNGYVRAILAYLAAVLGDRSRAESEIKQALQLAPNSGDVRFAAIETYEALGRREAALAVVKVAPPETLAQLSHWPDLADLHEDSRFRELMATHQVR